MSYRVTLFDWVLLAILVMVWGSSFVMSKIALHEISAVWIAAGRLTFGAAVLWCAAIFKNQRPQAKAADWIKYTWLGFIGNSLPFLIITWGMHFISSGIAGLLMGTIPLIMLALAHFFLPGEQMTKLKFLGFMLGFMGLTLIVDRSAFAQFSFSGGTAIGELAVVAGCLAYGVHGISAKRLGFNKPFEQAAGVLSAAAFLSVLFAVFADPTGWSGKSATAYLAVFGLGLFPTGIATVAMYVLMDRTSPTFTTTSNYLVPIYALLFGAVTLGESISWNAALALAFVLAGIYVSRFRQQPSQ